MEYDFSDFEDYVLNNFEKEDIEFIAEYGMGMAGISPWIYYSDCDKWFLENRKFVEDCFISLVYDYQGMDLKEVLNIILKDNDEFHNLRMGICWYLIETACITVQSMMEAEWNEE